MRFVGPISKRLQGPGADDLLTLARKLLGQTRNQMKLGGLMQGWGSLQLPDGSWLRCHSNWNGAAPMDFVWIETPTTQDTDIVLSSWPYVLTRTPQIIEVGVVGDIIRYRDYTKDFYGEGLWSGNNGVLLWRSNKLYAPGKFLSQSGSPIVCSGTYIDSFSVPTTFVCATGTVAGHSVINVYKLDGDILTLVGYVDTFVIRGRQATLEQVSVSQDGKTIACAFGYAIDVDTEAEPEEYTISGGFVLTIDSETLTVVVVWTGEDDVTQTGEISEPTGDTEYTLTFSYEFMGRIYWEVNTLKLDKFNVELGLYVADYSRSSDTTTVYYPEFVAVGDKPCRNQWCLSYGEDPCTLALDVDYLYKQRVYEREGRQISTNYVKINDEAVWQESSGGESWGLRTTYSSYARRSHYSNSYCSSGNRTSYWSTEVDEPLGEAWSVPPSVKVKLIRGRPGSDLTARIDELTYDFDALGYTPNPVPWYINKGGYTLLSGTTSRFAAESEFSFWPYLARTKSDAIRIMDTIRKIYYNDYYSSTPYSSGLDLVKNAGEQRDKDGGWMVQIDMPKILTGVDDSQVESIIESSGVVYRTQDLPFSYYEYASDSPGIIYSTGYTNPNQSAP